MSQTKRIKIIVGTKTSKEINNIRKDLIAIIGGSHFHRFVDKTKTQYGGPKLSEELVTEIRNDTELYELLTEREVQWRSNIDRREVNWSKKEK